MKIIDNDLLRSFREKIFCEFCGQRLRYASEAAHIFARGMGSGSRLDIRINICALGGPWDCACHHKHHSGGHPMKQELMEVSARREGVTPESVEAALYALVRAPKGSDHEKILAENLLPAP